MPKLWQILSGSCGLFAFICAFDTGIPLSAQKGPPEVRSFLKNNSTEANALADEAQRFATNERQFSIPFVLQSGQQVIVGLKLYVSFDRGQHWELSSQVAASQQQFDFTAQREGEYWFAVQTVDRNGLRSPATVAAPDLIVLVDRQKPELTASADDDAAGRIRVSWRAVDDHLASESLKIRYRQSGPDQATWTELPLKNPPDKATGPVYQDSIAFWPELDGNQFEIAVSIQDSAGNQATTTTSCTVAQPKKSVIDAQLQTPPQRSTDSVLNTTTQRPSQPAAPGGPVTWASQWHSATGMIVSRGTTKSNTEPDVPTSSAPVPSEQKAQSRGIISARTSAFDASDRPTAGKLAKRRSNTFTTLVWRWAPIPRRLSIGTSIETSTACWRRIRRYWTGRRP